MAQTVLTMPSLMIAAAIASVASAQNLPTPADVQSLDPSVLDLAGPSTGSVEPVPAPIEPIPESSSSLPFAKIPVDFSQHEDTFSLAPHCPSTTESSGTWLRRGLWYADLDAVVMARTWNDTGVTYVQEYEINNEQATGVASAFDIQSIVVVQSHDLSESSPGYDASARLALGRFLFRDQANRDHTFEMVVFGGAEWQENSAAEAQLTNEIGSDGLPAGLFQINNLTGQLRDQRGLHVPSSLDGSFPDRIDDVFSYDSFDRASSMEIEYASRFHSWEWNYNVAQRMRRDRMELSPEGTWVRRASPGFTWNYIAGLRYFDVEERLDWYAEDIASVDATNGDTDGFYDIDSSNNLFGFQIGAGLTYETDRWNVTVSTKHGFYVNDARTTASLTFTDPDGDTAIALENYDVDLHENGVSYLTQGAITARYHLRPNLSLRAGWEFMYVTGLALAPNQANFNPAMNQLNITGDVFYHGVTAGTEYYW